MSLHQIYESYARSKEAPRSTKGWCPAFQGNPHLIQPTKLDAWLGFLWQESQDPNSEKEKTDYKVKESGQMVTRSFTYDGNTWFECTRAGGCGKWHSGRAKNGTQWTSGHKRAPFQVMVPALTEQIKKLRLIHTVKKLRPVHTVKKLAHIS